MSKKSIEMAKLVDFTTCSTVIRCSICDYVDMCEIDEFGALENFHQEGWRVIENKCYCKECINKNQK